MSQDLNNTPPSVHTLEPIISTVRKIQTKERERLEAAVSWQLSAGALVDSRKYRQMGTDGGPAQEDPLSDEVTKKKELFDKYSESIFDLEQDLREEAEEFLIE